MMKTHAYYENELGEMILISGYKVYSLEAKEPGKWKRRHYYSTHKDPAHRRLMHFKQRNNKKYFAYNPTPVNQGEDPYSTHESLCHLLFKRALSNLKSTTFILRNQDDLPVTLNNAEMEKSIRLNGKTFRSDLYIEFTTDQGKKPGWQGRCYVEITFKNPTEGEKLEAFSNHFIPLIEVVISEKLAYENSPETSTPEKEDAYVERMVEVLSSFVYARVLSDPETRQDLIKKQNDMEATISDLKERVQELKTENKQLKEDHQNLNDLLITKQNQINHLESKITELQDKQKSLPEEGKTFFKGNPFKILSRLLFKREPKD